MRYMRLVASLLMLPPVFGVLTGCGGGNSVSSVQRTVTLTIQWPVASKASSLAHSRASVSTAQSVTVEVYDGTIPLIRKWLVTPSGTSATTLSLNLPAKALTFYANAYAQTTDPGYNTDPSTGQPAHGGPGSYTPLAPGNAQGVSADPHPVAHAVTVRDLSQPNPSLIFTMQNNITALVASGVGASVNLTSSQTPQIANYALDTPTVTLNNTVTGVTADGAIVMLPSTLVWSMSPSNALELARATVDSTTPTNPLLDLKATGLVHVTVTDTEVNPGQPPISATLTYAITPFATQRTVTLNTTTSGANASVNLMPTLPFYAQSLTYTLSQDALPASSSPTVLDSPPAPITSTPIAITPNYNLVAASPTFNSVTSVALPPTPIHFTATGRTLTLTVNAWSRPDGTGALLASYTQSGLPSVTGTVDPALTLKVNGFTLTPVLNNPAQVTTPPLTFAVTNTTTNSIPGQNTLPMQITASVTGDATPIPIDPRALKVTTDNAKVTPSWPLTPVDSNGLPYLLLTFDPTLATTPGVVHVTAADQKYPTTVNGTTAINVTAYTPTFNFH